MTLEHALTQINTSLCMKNMFIINIFDSRGCMDTYEHLIHA